MLILKFSFVICKLQAIECHIGHSVDSVLVSRYSIHAHVSVVSERYTFKVSFL